MSRYAGTMGLMRWLRPNPNLPIPQRDIAAECNRLAVVMLNAIPEDSPELSAGLRKLIEAKDCFVRASFGPEES